MILSTGTVHTDTTDLGPSTKRLFILVSSKGRLSRDSRSIQGLSFLSSNVRSLYFRSRDRPYKDSVFRFAALPLLSVKFVSIMHLHQIIFLLTLCTGVNIYNSWLGVHNKFLLSYLASCSQEIQSFLRTAVPCTLTSL